MTKAVGATNELDTLRQAVASGKLNADLSERAKALLAQIERPLRMSILGFPGSGKSNLINLLSGANLLPEGARLPAVQLSYGAEAYADCTLADGSIVSIENGDLAEAAKLNPVFVDAKYPLPAFKKLSLLEVAAGASHEEQRRALVWASKRTDMAVWCTERDFGDAEDDLWSLMPDRVQDHAFLVLSKADQLHANGSLPEVLAHLKSSSRDVFDTVYPVDFKTGLSARAANGSVDRELMRQSGAMALISAIRRVVDGGRQAMLDQAGVFLRQIGFDAAEEQSTATPAAPKPTAPTEPVSTSADVQPASLLPASREACEVAVAQLVAEGAYMADAFEQNDLPPETVIDTCADTIIWLSDYLSESGAQGDPLMDQTRAAAAEGADLIQLIQLETGGSVSSDALSILVQLKQELQAALAA